MSTDHSDENLYPFTPAPPDPGQPASATPKRWREKSRIKKTAAGLALVMGTGTGAAVVVAAGSSSPGPSLAASRAAPTDPSTPTTTKGATNNGPGAATSPPFRPATSPPFRRMFRHGPMGAMMGAMMAGPGGGFLGVPLFGAAGGRVVHASYTVKGPSGQYETIDTQQGTAQDVTSSSLTVKSADGFSQTYEVGSGTVVSADYEGILSVKVGDEVTVQATVSGTTIMAQQVTDLTQLQANRKAWAPGAVGDSPAPSLPPTSQSPSTNTPTTGGEGPGPSAA